MTQLLRNGDETAAALTWPAATANPAPAERDPTIAALEDQITELKASIDAQAQRHEREIEAAQSEAAAGARQQIARDEARALAILEQTLANVCAQHDAAMKQVERLAPAMCQAALDKLLDDPSRYHEVVVAAISKMMAPLTRDSVSYLAVSTEDFSPEVIAALGASHSHLQVRTDPELRRGQCRAGLTLGHVEFCIEDFRTRVRAQISEWASL